jgi:hypothetical protein
MKQWHPIADEIRTIVNRATNQLLLRYPKTDWVPMPWGPEQLEPPNAAGFVSVGMIVAVGESEEQDREVWWHPERQEGRVRRWE